ncbi:MAG: ATP-binding cassette domain-containing protein [Spirochaetales bacterium]|nr:ATP-binding cassette domain-containing protein [Spirochaetales bacterium]
MDTPLLEMHGISKTFHKNSVKAVDGANLIVGQSEIHIIIGENGAGKSTLMHILSGEVFPDSGKIIFNNREGIPGTPSEALGEGIGMLHQHIKLIPELTVLENIILGAEPSGGYGIINRKEAIKKLNRLSVKYDLSAEPDKLVSTLNSDEKQKTALLSILFQDIKLLILDEPTTFFSELKTDSVYKLIRKLKSIGKSVVIITHKLKEAAAIGDFITVMRGGKTILTLKASETDPHRLSNIIFGDEKNLSPVRSGSIFGNPLLELKNLLFIKNGKEILDISLTVREGEIVVVTGIRESGLETLEKLLSGEYKASAGIIMYKTAELSGRTELRKRKAGYIPSDRIKTGTSTESSIAENMILLNYKSFSKSGIFRAGSIKKFAYTLIKKYGITGVPGQIMSTLSGGNIQRVMISREIEANPELLIVAEPSRGLDIKSKSLIYNKIFNLKNKGSGILIISSDIEESLRIADRLIILYDGKVAYSGDGKGIDRSALGKIMLGYDR